MYKKEFDKELASGLKAKSYLFFGAEPYYISKYSKLIADKITPHENRLVFYYDEYDFESAKNYLSQASLFGDTNLLILKNDKQIPTKDLKTLIEICKKTPNSYFIYELYANTAPKITQIFHKENDAVHVRFFKPFESEALKELSDIAASYNLNIDHATLRHLYHLVQEDLMLAAKELEKLSIYQEVGTKEIDALVYPLSTLHLETLYKAILTKAPLAQLLQRIEEEDLDIIAILLGLERYVKDLFLYYSYIRLHGKADSKEILGYKPPKDVEKERIELAIKIKNYPEIFLTLQECEYQLKTMKDIDKKSLLYSCLMKIQALI